jgi:hypothetical protein
MIRQIITFLFKAFILYLAFLVLLLDLILIETSLPRFIFEKQPFFYSWVIVVLIGAIISTFVHSRTPFLWAIFCPALSAFIFFIFARHATAFIAFFLAIGAISFIYRNKITEPFLILLPILAGGWLFLHFVYTIYLVSWAYYVTGQKAFGEAIFQGLLSVSDQGVQIALVLPIFLMYFLGKQGYTKLYPIYASLRFNKRLNGHEI